MITKQVIKTSIEELKEVSKTDFFVVDGQGLLMAATSKETPNTEAMICLRSKTKTNRFSCLQQREIPQTLIFTEKSVPTN